MRDRIFGFVCITIFGAIVIQSCGTSNKLGGVSFFENKYVRIEDSKMLSSDPKIAHLVYKNGEEFYVEELSSTDGLPISIESRFDNAFKTYHYHKFFELVHVDPRLTKIFIDSVDVVDILPAGANYDQAHQLYECKPCNAKAIILFKNRMYTFPITVAEKWFEEESNYIFSAASGQNMYPSVKYLGKSEELPSGFYFIVDRHKIIHIYTNTTGGNFEDIVRSVRFFRI